MTQSSMKQFSEAIPIDTNQAVLFGRQSSSGQNYFFEFLQTHASVLCSILSQYDFVDGSRGSVSRCDIEKDSIALDGEGNGSFKVSFAVHYFYACDYITKDYRQTMTMQSRLDSVTEQIIISGEQWNERDMDEF